MNLFFSELKLKSFLKRRPKQNMFPVELPPRADSEADLDNFRSSVGLELVSLKTTSGDIGERVRAMGNHHEVTAMAHRHVSHVPPSLDQCLIRFDARKCDISAKKLKKGFRLLS